MEGLGSIWRPGGAAAGGTRPREAREATQIAFHCLPCPVPRSVESCHTNQNPKFPVQRANMIFLLSEARGIGINDSDILLYFYTAFHCPCFERFRSNVSFNLLQPDSPGRRDCRNMTPLSMMLLSPILSVQLSHTYLLYQACCSVHDK